MEQKINNLIQALLCKRVEGCKCDMSVNKALISYYFYIVLGTFRIMEREVVYLIDQSRAGFRRNEPAEILELKCVHLKDLNQDCATILNGQIALRIGNL